MKQEAIKELEEIYKNLTETDPYTLERQARKILDIAKQNNVISHGSSDLGDAIGKEIKWAQGAEREMVKPTAAKIRKKEFEAAMSKANAQVSLHLSLILMDLKKQ